MQGATVRERDNNFCRHFVARARDGPNVSTRVTRLTLMAYRQHEHTIARFVVTVESEVAAPAARDHELAEARLDRPAQQGMVPERLDRRYDKLNRLRRGRQIACGRKINKPLDIG